MPDHRSAGRFVGDPLVAEALAALEGVPSRKRSPAAVLLAAQRAESAPGYGGASKAGLLRVDGYCLGVATPERGSGPLVGGPDRVGVVGLCC
jgi:hypothetical protein